MGSVGRCLGAQGFFSKESWSERVMNAGWGRRSGSDSEWKDGVVSGSFLR